MAELINLADICIGSCGISSYERMYLGKPSITYTIADNQLYIATKYSEIKGFKYLGHYDEYDKNILIQNLKYWIDNIKEVKLILGFS